MWNSLGVTASTAGRSPLPRGDGFSLLVDADNPVRVEVFAHPTAWEPTDVRLLRNGHEVAIADLTETGAGRRAQQRRWTLTGPDRFGTFRARARSGNETVDSSAFVIMAAPPPTTQEQGGGVTGAWRGSPRPNPSRTAVPAGAPSPSSRPSRGHRGTSGRSPATVTPVMPAAPVATARASHPGGPRAPQVVPDPVPPRADSPAAPALQPMPPAKEQPEPDEPVATVSPDASGSPSPSPAPIPAAAPAHPDSASEVVEPGVPPAPEAPGTTSESPAPPTPALPDGRRDLQGTLRVESGEYDGRYAAWVAAIFTLLSLGVLTFVAVRLVGDPGWPDSSAPAGQAAEASTDGVTGAAARTGTFAERVGLATSTLVIGIGAVLLLAGAALGALEVRARQRRHAAPLVTSPGSAATLRLLPRALERASQLRATVAVLFSGGAVLSIGVLGQLHWAFQI